MPSYVEVAVNLPVASGLFHYHVPPELSAALRPGCLVVVPFGKQQVQGVVWRLLEHPEVTETKAVTALLDSEPALNPLQLKLAGWLSAAYLAPLSQCFDLMLPPGLSQMADTLYTLNPQALPPGEQGGLSQRLIELLSKRGPLRGRQIDSAFPPRLNWRSVAQTMARRGWLVAQAVLPPPSARSKSVREVRLAVPVAEIEARLAAVPRQSEALRLRRLALLEFLAAQSEPVEPAWALAAAPGCTDGDLQRLVDFGLIAFQQTETIRDPLERFEFTPSGPPRLTAAQNVVWEQVRGVLRRPIQSAAPPPHILHGITGSGKTEIYLHAVAETLAQGRQALVMVPEISLTPQTVRRFAARFPGQVGLVHSRLSEGERYDTWRRARAGQLPVIVGARSALFTPLERLGLIVVDEFHDESYYQDDSPAYSAVEAALNLAHDAGALLLLGSATPDISLMQRAAQQHWPVLRLPDRVLAHREAVALQMNSLGRAVPDLPEEGEGAGLPLPAVKVVDMRQELKAGNRTIFSRALQAGMEETLARGEQVLLFLNRRGTATYVFCRDCGASVRCPRCDLPLTYHASPERLLCHTCNYTRAMPTTCPTCRSKQIRQLGLGTERVESEVQQRFPGARVLRWDAETTRQRDAHDLILGHFAAGRADILVGTQMVAKGLDLPLVTLVGVILADVGLTLPDYRAGERGFQLLTQVAGRAGRSPLGGRVVLQTYLPDHYAVQAASQHDFEGFMRRELAFRRQHAYPPFVRLVRLERRDTDARRVEEEAQRMGRKVAEWLEQGGLRATRMIGPAPCFFARQNGMFRWQIVLAGPDPLAALRGRDLGEWRVQVDPPALL